MTDRFLEVLPDLLREEGGWVNDPHDPGGETNLGITRAVYEAWTHQRGADMHHLTPDDVAPIYRVNYWRASGCDLLPVGVDRIVFDTAVNMGVSRAVKYLQRAAGVADDGHIGPMTQAAIVAADPGELINGIAALREAKYRALPTFPRFGRGWLARLARVKSKAKAEA